jgi:hypothetical protein
VTVQAQRVAGDRESINKVWRFVNVPIDPDSESQKSKCKDSILNLQIGILITPFDSESSSRAGSAIRSSQDVFDHFTVDVGQAAMDAIVVKGQFFVIQPQ